MEIFCITKCITNLYNKACPLRGNSQQPSLVCSSICSLVSPFCSLLSFYPYPIPFPFPFLISLLVESSIFWEAPPFLYWVKGVWIWIYGYIFYWFFWGYGGYFRNGYMGVWVLGVLLRVILIDKDWPFFFKF